ncbi:hypothetical protein [Anaerosinus sp.]|uniref:hypothetical protein n=1 Tax=Selenobaculum sp. TaxID=3074374 RepID=UPI003AB56085
MVENSLQNPNNISPTMQKIASKINKTMVTKVEISDIGKKLHENTTRENNKGEKTKEADSLQRAAQDRMDKLNKISELEDKFKKGDFTDKEAESLKKEIEEMKEDAKTPQEKMRDNINLLKKQKNELEEKISQEQEFGSINNMKNKMSYLDKKISDYEQQITDLYDEAHNLSIAARQEESDQLAAKIKEDLMTKPDQGKNEGKDLGDLLIAKQKEVEKEKAEESIKDDDKEKDNEVVGKETDDFTGTKENALQEDNKENLNDSSINLLNGIEE